MGKVAKIAFAIFILGAASAEAGARERIKKIKYKSHTEIDFTGSSVEGKVRSPEVFYIFQRRRTEGPAILEAPNTMDTDRRATRKILEDQL